MSKIADFVKQTIKRINKKEMGVGLSIGLESFSLCVISDPSDATSSAHCESHKFPTALLQYTPDFFASERSAQYIFDFIKDFLPKENCNLNLALPEHIANIAVTPVAFSEKDEAIGYARFQASELFGRSFKEPIFFACTVSDKAWEKSAKCKFIVAVAEARDMIMLDDTAEASKIFVASAEPVALCGLRAYIGLSQGTVLLVFMNLSHLFAVLLVNGSVEKFYTPSLDTENENFLAEFCNYIAVEMKEANIGRDNLKIKIAGNEAKYELCEVLDKLGIAREVSLAQCHAAFASCEEELAFGAAMRC